MARTIGRAFPINKNQARSYSYAAPPRKTKKAGKLRRNAGVTHIAAINGKGSYRGRKTTTARRSMTGLSANARLKRAKAALKREERKSKTPKTNSARKRTSSVTNRRKPSMRRNAQTAAQREASLKNLRKARAARRKSSTTRRAAPKRNAAKRTRSSASAPSAAAKKGRRRATTAKKKALARNPTARRRTSAKRSAAAKKGWRKRRAAMTSNRRKAAPKRNSRKPAKRTTRRRTIKRNAWHGDSERHSLAAKKGWRRRRAGAKRSAAAKKGWRKRRSRAAFRKKSGMAANRRRTGKRRLRRNARMSYVSNRRRRVKRRRPMRRNRGMRRNQGIAGALKAGLFVTLGLVSHKIVTGVVRDLLFKPAVAAAVPEAVEAPPTSGLGQINGYGGVAVGAATAIAGILVVNRVMKNESDRKMVVGGIAASFVHSAIVAALDLVGQPKAATMLAGVEDGTAAKISAMYGLGAGTSIQPEYAPIGEYFKGAPMGEYFASGVQGLGAVKPYEASAGVGNAGYASNPDLYQAAAGMGAMEHQGNHIDPSTDLDRELTIAEAAAGVGAAGDSYQAAAGVRGTGEYFASGVQGLGAAPPTPVTTVPRSNTWIPGMSDPAIWAGVKSVDEPQSAHAMLTAGILQTDGGQGVFG